MEWKRTPGLRLCERREFEWDVAASDDSLLAVSFSLGDDDAWLVLARGWVPVPAPSPPPSSSVLARELALEICDRVELSLSTCLRQLRRNKDDPLEDTSEPDPPVPPLLLGCVLAAALLPTLERRLLNMMRGSSV